MLVTLHCQDIFIACLQDETRFFSSPHTGMKLHAFYSSGYIVVTINQASIASKCHIDVIKG